MLTLVTGVPGASKTAYVVTQLLELENKNKINIVKNKQIFNDNFSLFERYRDDFRYYEYESGSGHELKTYLEVLSDDYFDFILQDFDDLRPDDYFYKIVKYNEIIERIKEREDDNLAFKHLLPVRTIYTNIKSLKIPFTPALIYDWRDCPDGSVIVIDEVQLVEPYSDVKNKNNEIVQELTIHRHRGFDFYFITQYPSLLHPTIKDLVACHLHITRPFGRTPKIYRFGSTRAYPNTLVNKLNCEAKFSFKPNPKIFKLYKSTTIDTHKPRMPKGLIFFGGFVLFSLFLFFYGLSGGGGFFKHFYTDSDKSNTVVATDNKNSDVTDVKPTHNYQFIDFSQVKDFSGCIKSHIDCRCYTKDGGSIKVNLKQCILYLDSEQ